MADVKSAQVQTLDAEPTEVLEPGVLAGRVRIAKFSVDLTDVTGSDVAYCIDLPPNAVLHEVRLFQDGSDSTSFDFGDSNSADGILDGQAINQEVSIQAANNNTTGTNGFSPEDWFKPLWEALGYSSRIAAGSRIRLKLTPGSEPADNTIFGTITYVVD